MDIKIISKKENPLLNRTEIKFISEYQGEQTPKLLDIKHKIIALENASKELLVVDHVKPEFGVGTATGMVKVYDSIEKLNEIETKSVILKNEEPTEEENSEESTEEE